MEVPNRHPMIRVARIVAGTALMVAGVVGLVLPVLPGWLLIVPGLTLLSTEFRWAMRVRDRLWGEYQKRREQMSRRSRSES